MLTAAEGHDTIAQGLLYDSHTLSLHLTDTCNARCVFCGEGSPDHAVDAVRTADIVDFLRTYAGSDWRTVNIHGGEPTIRPDFIEILTTIRDLGYERIIVQTNAYRMANERFAEAVHAVGVDVFTSGFHGHTPALATEIAGHPQAFELAVRGFAHITAGGATLRTTTVVCRPNAPHIDEVVRVSLEHGATHLNISAMQPGGCAEDRLDDLLVTYREAFPQIEAAVERGVAAGATVTLEGFPYCAVPGHEARHVAWRRQQLKVLYRNMVIDDFDRFLCTTTRSQGPPCRSCAVSHECGGVYRGYLEHVGWDEFAAYPVQSGSAEHE